MKKKILIVRPFGKKGGQVVLAVVCRLLREKGYDAKIFHVPYEAQIGMRNTPREIAYIIRYWFHWLKFAIKRQFQVMRIRITHDELSENVYLNFSVIEGIREKLTPFYNRKNTIVIYPEKVYGNFLFAKNVVRYIMYYTNEAGEKTYGENDLFIYFRNVFNNKRLNPEELEIPFYYFDNSLYRQYNYGNRKGNCYFIRKGIRHRQDIPSEFDGPILDNLTEIEKVKILNQCKYCYIYDTQTFYSFIASICGCISIVMLEPGKTVSDYLGENEIHYGVAYGNTPEQIKYAIESRPQLLASLDYTASNNKNIEKFINVLTTRFGELSKIR